MRGTRPRISLPESHAYYSARLVIGKPRYHKRAEKHSPGADCLHIGKPQPQESAEKNCCGAGPYRSDPACRSGMRRTWFGYAELPAPQSKRFLGDFFAGEVQAIVYILASLSRGKAPKRIVLRQVRLIPRRHNIKNRRRWARRRFAGGCPLTSLREKSRVWRG